MNIEIFSKDNCPYCERAKALLKSKDLRFKETKVTSPDQLPKPEFRTVPQIVIDGEFVGGFNELTSFLPKYLETNKRSTVFNKNNTGYLTSDYPLFLGEQLGFSDTINNPYPELDELFHTQSAQIWGFLEVDLTADRQDMLSAPKEIVDLMVQNITWQSLADSVASRAIGSVLMESVSNSSLQDLYNAIIYFESIHNQTYQHIIKQTFVNPNEVLRQGYANLQAIKRSDVLVEAFDNLANSSTTDLKEKRKLILFCVLALYLLESINFMASFACTFAIAERGYFQGISQNVILICRDEILHARAGKTILGILVKQWPETFEQLKPQLESMLNSVINDEEVWADYLFSEGRQIIGLNANNLKQYVQYCAEPVRATLGLPMKGLTNPLPFMEQYIDSSSIQTANQEIQNVAYLVNSVKASPAEVMEETLAKLREQYL